MVSSKCVSGRLLYIEGLGNFSDSIWLNFKNRLLEFLYVQPIGKNKLLVKHDTQVT
jgi:hypothetical protein